jgi:hypothetical protein
MAGKISRRQFFNLTGQKLRKPIRVVFVFVIAWLAIAAIQAARGITLYGWKLIGCVVFAAVVLATLRYGAIRVYSLLPRRGKALCTAMGEALSMLGLMAIGVLLWHWFQTEHAIGVAAVVVLVCVADKVCKVYNQRMAELRSSNDAGG